MKERTSSLSRALRVGQTNALAILLMACKAVNPAFDDSVSQDQRSDTDPTTQQDPDSGVTAQEDLDASSKPDLASSRPALTAFTSTVESVVAPVHSTPTSSTSIPTSGSSTASSTTTSIDPGLAQLCPPTAQLCYPMIQRQSSSQAAEEQHGALPLTFQDDLTLENLGSPTTPWDHILKINSYSGTAVSSSGFTVANENELGLEVWAEGLECQSPGNCTVAAIDGLLAIEYNNSGQLHCRLNDNSGTVQTAVSSSATQLRIACWFQGNQLFVRGTHATILMQANATLSSQPTRVSIAGIRPRTGTNTMQGSIALLRVWTNVQDFESRMASHIYSADPSP